MNKGIVHISNFDGHRQAYRDLFANIFGFDKLVQPVSGKSFFTLISADRLLFATVGGAFYRYFLVCLFRVLLFKPSATLFLGANKYCDKKGIDFDQMLLRVWKALPQQHLFSIISHKIAPRLSRITNGYIYDPQLWDICFEMKHETLPVTELSKSVVIESKGRKILLFLGKAKISKAFVEFTDFASANKEEIYAVAAGKVSTECTVSAGLLNSHGMMVVDRYISDEELLSLYKIANLVWCYYGPAYDQSSGVFGRAIQLGVSPIIRKNSIIEKIAIDFNVPSYAVELKTDSDYKEVYDRIKKYHSNTLSGAERKELFKELAEESLLKLKQALGLK